MKIYAISPFTYKNINKTEKNTGYYFSNVSTDVVSFSTKKPVSFGNKVEHTLVKLQARDLENKTGTDLKDSTSINQEA